MASPFKKHLAAIEAGNLTRSNVIGIKKALNADFRRRNRWSVGATSPNVSHDQCNLLEVAIEARRPVVTGQLHDSGLALLRSKRYAKQLAKVATIIPDIARFRLIRYDRIDNERHAIPVYLAETADGRAFTFWSIPWQSGGNGPELL